jgi:glycosyltransferase involved in cell wall biosynthesis
MEEKAKESDIFKEFKIKTIFNNINSDDFFPVNKSVAQNLLGIDTPKKIILLGAANFQTFYKGFSKFVEAVKNLNPSKYFLCFFGNMEKSIADSLGFEYKNFGFLYDAISLRLLYSSADVFVAPSLMDAFGKTLPESMACETPVVCFNATGPRDIVHHKVNGYKAEPFQAEDIAKGIEWVITNNQNNQLGKNAREKVLKCFDSKVVAKQYIELYQQILSKA